MEPIITGILSYGMSGRIFHAPFIATHPGFKLHAVTERSTQKAAIDYPGIRSYKTVEDLLADPAIELVIVNTPSNTHFSLAKQALLAKKHVLVEKPFAASSAEAEELFSLAKQVGRYCMAYQNRRWDSDFLSLKQVIGSGSLGRLIEVNFRFDRYKRELSPKKFKEQKQPASGLLYDLGPHLTDQVISLFGEPLTSRRSTGMFRPGTVVEDYISWQLVYPGNLHVNITSSLLTAAPVPSFIAHGENGSYIKSRTDIQETQLDQGMKPNDPAYGHDPEGTEGQLVIMHASGEKEITSVKAPAGNYNVLFDAVANQLRNQVPYVITEHQVMVQMKLLEG